VTLWRQFTRGLHALLRSKAADRDIADEIEGYLEQSAAAYEAAGLSPAEARRQARLEMSGATAVREQVRSYGWENTVASSMSDLRYAARRLRGSLGFTTISIVTLALGIGASTAIFSVIEGVLLKPLSYPESERIIAIRHTAPGIHIEDLNVASSLYFTYTEENRVFRDVGMWRSDTASVTGVGQPEEVPCLVVTNRFLPVLGVQPALGRGFSGVDDHPKSERAVILSDGYWKSHFGADRSVLGRRILLDGDAHTVIGVMPPSFQFLDLPFSLLIPLRVERANVGLISFCCQGIARLKPGVTLTQADADVTRMLALAPAKFPVNPGFSSNVWATARIAPRLFFLKDYQIGDIGKTLWMLMATVGIVLAIACANVANLLLVRADGRRQELAVRAALGAGWGRLARELLLESLLLSVVSGAFGLALAYGAVRVLAAARVENLPRIQEVSIDPFVVLFALSISLAAGLLFGLIPVFKYARPGISAALSSGTRSVSQSKEHHRARSLLVIVQVALAVVLLVGSGLMIRTFQALRSVDPGFSHAEHLETFHVSIPESQAPEPERALRMEQEMLRKLESIAGVSSVAIASNLPMEGGQGDPVYAEDHPDHARTVPPIRTLKFVSPGYFSTIGARLIAGRDLTWAETYNQTPVALVSENMARELWRDPRSAIGKRVRPTLKDDWREVIGVVADLRDVGVDQKAPGIVYWPLFQKNFESSPAYFFRNVGFLIRTPRAGSLALLEDIQKSVARVNSTLPVADVKTLGSVYKKSLARTSFSLVLLAMAGAMALLLGLIGIYGVISYSVSQRTREIGIRLALGAPLENLTKMFVRYGLLLSAAGVAFGLIAALRLTRLMKSILYEVSPSDPITYLGVSAGLVFAAALASYLPARKATKVDPVVALRAD